MRNTDTKIHPRRFKGHHGDSWGLRAIDGMSYIERFETNG